MSYGLEVYDVDGTSKVISPNMRFGTLLDFATNVNLAKDVNGIPEFIDFQMDMTGVSPSTVAIVELSDGGWTVSSDYEERYEFLSDRIRVNASIVAFFGDIYILRF